MTIPVKYKPPGLGEFEENDKIGFEHGGTNAATLLEAQDNLGISSKAEQSDLLALETELTDLTEDVDTKADADSVNQALALKADLVDGKVPAAQLPSFVDDVLEGRYIDPTTFDDLDSNPYTPETSKIYVDVDTNMTYRWSGMLYVVTGGGGVALGETSSTAYRGDRGKEAYDHSLSQGNPHNSTTSDITEGTRKYFTEQRVLDTPMTGLSEVTASDVLSTDALLVTIEKLIAQIKLLKATWVPISSVATVQTYVTVNNIEVARINGNLWIRGTFQLNANPGAADFITITDNNYKTVVPNPADSNFNRMGNIIAFHYENPSTLNYRISANRLNHTIQGPSGFGITTTLMTIQPTCIGKLMIQ